MLIIFKFQGSGKRKRQPSMKMREVLEVKGKKTPKREVPPEAVNVSLVSDIG